MKILCCYDFDWQKEFIQKKLPSCEFSFVKGTIRNCTLPHDKSVEGLCIFIDSPITVEILDRFPHLKFIVTRSSGFDHINLIETQKRTIIVSSVPAYGKYAVAEYTIGLLLALARNICNGRELTRQGIFSDPQLVGFDLYGKTLGIIGTGTIGAHVAQLAKAFGMTILAHDVKPNQKLATELGFTYVSLDKLIANADIITLHVCYTPQTHHLINRVNIKNLKPGSYIINTSRGAVIDTLALVHGLEEKILAGIALDVFEEEAALTDENLVLLDKKVAADKLQTILATHYLAHHPHVLTEPHNAYNTKQALESIWKITVDNFKAFIAGKPINLAQVQTRSATPCSLANSKNIS